MSNGDAASVNPFLALRKLKQEQVSPEGTAPVIEEPTYKPPENPFLRLREGNPYLGLRGGARPFSFAAQHPVLEGLIVQPVRDISNFIKLMVTRGELGFYERTPVFRHDPTSQMKRDLENEMWGPATQEEEETRQSAIRGGAFLASFAAGGAAEAFLPAIAGPLTEGASAFLRPGPVLGKWGSYAVNEFLGGGIYGSLRPLEEDESRFSAVFGDASTFASAGLIFGGIGAGVSSALKARIWRLPEARRDAAIAKFKQAMDMVDSDLSAGGVNASQLPPDARAKIEEPILRRIVQEADPAANVNEVVRAESDRALEATPSEPAAQSPVEKFDEAAVKITPPHPMEETPALEASAAAPPAGAVPPEREITSIAVMGRDGHVYTPKRGEILHPELIANLHELDGVSLNEFVDPKTGKYASGASTTGYKLRSGAYINKDEATVARLAGQTPGERYRADERVVGPAVRGASGKVYVGGANHPETMAEAIRNGVPKKEFKGVIDNADHPGRGFRTSKREFISREEASKIMKRPVPLYSEDVHAEKMLSTESTGAAEQAAGESAKPEDAKITALDAATDHATAQLEPLKTATPGVKVAADEIDKLIKIHGLPEKAFKKHLLDLLSHSLEQDGPDADRVVLLALTQPGPIELQVGKNIGSANIKRIRELFAKSLRKEEPMVEVSPHERVAAPSEEVDPDLTVPKKMDGMEIVGHVRDDKLDEFNQALLDAARSKTSGFVRPELLVRLTAAGIGGTMEAIGWMDDNLSPGIATSLKAYGGLILLASIFPGYRHIMEKSEFIRDMKKMFVPTRAMSKGGEVWREYMEAFTKSGLKRHEMEVALRSHFPTEEASRAAMYVMDEGAAAPEFHSLTTHQQQMATIMHQFNVRLGLLLKASGEWDEYQENFVRHLLQPPAFQKWKQMGGIRALPGTANVRALEAWAKKEGVAGPIMDVAAVHSHHTYGAVRAEATARLTTALKQQNRILPLPPAGTPLPAGWRDMEAIPGMRGKMAPEEDAHDLAIISRFDSPKGELGNALDRIKSRWVKSIMFFWWEHGFNAVRSYLALSFNPSKYYDGVKWLEHPAIREEMASVGVNVYGQSSDYLLRVQDSWKNLFNKVGLPSLGARIDKLQEMNDKKLWEKIIPALQTFAYVTRMRDWVERNSGKFGGPEYLAEARRVADFANTIAGKVPQQMADPRIARGLRLMMFSPQWTGTRIAMWMHASGELSDIMAGKLNPRDALYLPLKYRQLAWGVTLTTLGSLALSGKLPEFNPNNTRFYMRTGLKDARGREMGLDLAGWFQDEFRLFNHPFDFIMNRANPMLKIGQETLTGRDYLGRSMTTGQTVGNILSAFGPPTQILGDVARVGKAAVGRGRIGGGDVLQMASRALATGNVAVLPKPMDVTLSKYARKILINQGIPATTDNIYELAQRMRGNLINGKDLIDEGTVMLLASRKRSAMWEVPLPGSAAFNAIWQESRGVLADFLP